MDSNTSAVENPSALKSLPNKNGILEKRAVIVLGLSQHGKTTFMNGLVDLQHGSIEGDGEVGSGTERCTVNPEIFKLYQASQPTKFLRFDPLPEPKPIKKDDEDAQFRAHWKMLSQLDEDSYLANVALDEPVVAGGGLLAGERLGGRMTIRRPLHLRILKAHRRMLDSMRGSRDADEQEDADEEDKCQDQAGDKDQAEVSLVSRGADEREDADEKDDCQDEDGDKGKVFLQIEALDTPGVEDSKGEDDDNMTKIIDMVLQMGSLCGLVMVSKCGTPITPTWKEQVKRYYKQFPMLAAQWIFVHTNADPYAKNNPQRRKQSSFESAMEQRERLVKDAMCEVTGDKQFEAAHISIESDVEDEEALKTFLAQQHNSILSILANFKTVQVDTLPFQKGPHLLKVNAALLGALHAMMEATKTTLRELQNEHADLLRMKDEHRERTASLRTSIRDIEVDLFNYDNDGPVDAIKYLQDSWHFFSYARDKQILTSRHANYTLSIVDQSGYAASYAEVTTKKTIEKTNTGCEVVEIEVAMQALWRSLNVKVVLSSPMCDVYREKIVRLKASLEPLRANLEDMEKEHRAKETELAAKDESMRQTTIRHDKCSQMLDFLDMAWTCHTYKSMKPFYQKAKGQDLPPAELLKEFESHWEQCKGCL